MPTEVEVVTWAPVARIISVAGKVGKVKRTGESDANDDRRPHAG